VLITVVNPNTSWDMTGMIELTARAVAGPDTTIRAVSPAMGPASIESHYDEALAVPGVLAEVESEVNDPGLFVPQVGLVIAP
jgi:allantoin racemase